MNAKQRFDICKSCAYSKRHNLLGVVVTTCGNLDLLSIPPVIGETIIHEGKKVKLCGCNMKIRTMLPESKCPVNNW